MSSRLATLRLNYQGVAPALCWFTLLIAIFFCYWPGLFGGFVFDDDVNILRNDRLKISSLSFSDLWAAAMSGDAGPLGRPVALFTFALNYYLSPNANPFQFKIVNVVIHLINTITVGYLGQIICDTLIRRRSAKSARGNSSWWAGFLVATLWGLHPINLTGVLYVVQRMTSLCALFGLIAVAIYTRYRSATAEHVKFKNPEIWAVATGAFVLIFLLLSVLSKESGILFIPLIGWIEWQIYSFRFNGKGIRFLGRDLRQIATWVICASALCSSFFVLPTLIGPGAYINRDFTLGERLLTEARALVFYLEMFVLPVNSKLSLYHDDFAISRSLFDPLSTAWSLSLLLLISAVTWLLRKKYGVLLFGWGWFLISHSLESSVFALELVYEHRNYFAIIGPIVAIVTLTQTISSERSKNLLGAGLICYGLLFGFVTHVRSLQWSNIVDWAALEAINKPMSTRANYELARVYIILMTSTKNPQFGELADQALIRAGETEYAGVLPLFGRLQLAYIRGTTPSLATIRAVETELSTGKYRNSNTAALGSFINCQIQTQCKMDDAEVERIWTAALSNPLIPRGERAEVLKLVAQYKINRTNDILQGIRFIRQSIEVQDKVPSRIMLAQALAMSGDFDEALLELDHAADKDDKNLYRPQIARERNGIELAKKER